MPRHKTCTLEPDSGRRNDQVTFNFPAPVRTSNIYIQEPLPGLHFYTLICHSKMESLYLSAFTEMCSLLNGYVYFGKLNEICYN